MGENFMLTFLNWHTCVVKIIMLCDKLCMHKKEHQVSVWLSFVCSRAFAQLLLHILLLLLPPRCVHVLGDL